jgi:hypothetical protein
MPPRKAGKPPSCRCKAGCGETRYCSCLRAGAVCGAACACVGCSNCGAAHAAVESPAAAAAGPLALPPSRSPSPPRKRAREGGGMSVAAYLEAQAVRAAFAAAHAQLCARYGSQPREANAAAWETLLARASFGAQAHQGAFGRAAAAMRPGWAMAGARARPKAATHALTRAAAATAPLPEPAAADEAGQERPGQAHAVLEAARCVGGALARVASPLFAVLRRAARAIADARPLCVLRSAPAAQLASRALAHTAAPAAEAEAAAPAWRAEEPQLPPSAHLPAPPPQQGPVAAPAAAPVFHAAQAPPTASQAAPAVAVPPLAAAPLGAPLAGAAGTAHGGGSPRREAPQRKLSSAFDAGAGPAWAAPPADVAPLLPPPAAHAGTALVPLCAPPAAPAPPVGVSGAISAAPAPAASALLPASSRRAALASAAATAWGVCEEMDAAAAAALAAADAGDDVTAALAPEAATPSPTAETPRAASALAPSGPRGIGLVHGLVHGGQRPMFRIKPPAPPPPEQQTPQTQQQHVPLALPPTGFAALPPVAPAGAGSRRAQGIVAAAAVEAREAAAAALNPLAESLLAPLSSFEGGVVPSAPAPHELPPPPAALLRAPISGWAAQPREPQLLPEPVPASAEDSASREPEADGPAALPLPQPLLAVAQ